MQILAALLILCLFALPAYAKGDADMYAVHGISVDATAENASAARDKAIAQGARKGLEQLLQTLSGGTDPKSMPLVTEKTASSLVQDFDVESERASGTRYIAVLGYRFRPDGVQAMLAGTGAKFVTSKAPLTLIIPVYRAASGDLLWQPENTWRVAWKDAAARSGLVPVVVPDGTPEDAQMFTANDLHDEAKLDALGQKYKADAEAVVIASAASPTGDPTQGLQLSFVGAGKGTDNFHSDGVVSPTDTLAKGVAASLNELDQQWRNHALKGAFGPILFKGAEPAVTDSTTPFTGNQYAIQAQFTGPGDWPALRNRLSQIQGVQRVQLKSLSRDGAVVVLGVAGDDNQLVQTLGAAGITLGSPQAIPAGDSEVSAMVPSTGPGAGLIYPVTGLAASQ